jgi:hypothetical protein
VVTSVTHVDIKQMRNQLFFEGPERKRRLSRFWLLLLLSAVIATAGVVSDSTATVIGAMIIAPLMTPILGAVLGPVLTDRANLGRCLLLLAAGAAAVVAVSWLLGHPDPCPVLAATNIQVAARVTPRLVDLVAAVPPDRRARSRWPGSMSPTPCRTWLSPSRWCRRWPWPA